MFYHYVLFQLTNEINSLNETNYGDHNFIHITNKVAYRACRARGDGRVAFATLVVTCCVAIAVQHARHSTYNFFLYQNAWAR